MSLFGDLLGNEESHLGNLFGNFGIKNAEQLALGAADPIGAKIWSGITGQNFTPMVGQLGGETDAQYAQSQAQGVNTGPSQFMGGVANTIAGAEAGGYFAGAAGLGNGLSGALGKSVLANGITSGANGLDGSSAAPPANPSDYSLPGAAMTQQQKLAMALMQPGQQSMGGAQAQPSWQGTSTS